VAGSGVLLVPPPGVEPVTVPVRLAVGGSSRLKYVEVPGAIPGLKFTAPVSASVMVKVDVGPW
jgi:hypothetical protein